MQPGQTLLQYRLVSQIGEGGMGVVWRAMDTTLNREVALKVLPQAFAQDPDRLARFEREARLLASLNHPNIAILHGLHEAGGQGGQEPLRFLTMELVEGEDLATRLEGGPLPVHDALVVAAQVARALEAAHGRGVVHRDLKPANVVLTADDKAKVLDFGLAKAMDTGAASGSSDRAGGISLSPTVTTMGTVAGVILGTAAYMSPEQARGKPVDRRADIWSFGCLLYECLTGVRLFRGETVSDSLAAILRKEIDFSKLPTGTPPLVRVLLRRCLTRDPEKRLQDAGDARLELEQALEDPSGALLGLTAAAGPVRPAAAAGARWLPWVVAAAAVAVAGITALTGPATEPRPATPRHLTIPVPGPTEFGDLRASPPVISPDGRAVVFGAVETSGESRLWLRPLDSFTARPLEGTAGAEYAFWSPDSREIGFFIGGRLKRLDIAMGRAQTIGGEGSSYPRGASWGRDGRIIYAPNSNAGIHLIDAGGGAPRQITTPDPDVPDCSHRWPAFLPDGEHFLFVLWSNDLQAQAEHGGVYVASISGDEPARRILSDPSSVAYVPPGRLLVVRGENLIAVPFDAAAREVTGEPDVIANGVLRNRANGHGAFSLSRDGVLVYAEGQAFIPSALTWYDRSGNQAASPLEPAPYARIRLAPDARRAVVSIPGPNGDNEIWIADLERGVRTRLFQAPTQSDYPIWSGDGTRVLYASQSTGFLNFWVRNADGSGEAEPVFVNDYDKVALDWSRDGRWIAYWPMDSGSGTPDIWIYSLQDERTSMFLSGEPSYGEARFSPDGSWLIYTSDDSGRPEVFVQALELGDGIRAGARWQVSTAGGSGPHWRDDGREIVYLDPERRVMAVTVEVQQGRVSLGAPRALFTVDRLIATGDVSGDHERFLLATRDAVSSKPLRVILNWDAGL